MDPYGGLSKIYPFFIICSMESEGHKRACSLCCLHSEDETSAVGSFSMIFPWFDSQKVAAREPEPKWPYFSHCTLSASHGFISSKPFNHFHLNNFHKAPPSTKGMATCILYGYTRVISQSTLVQPKPDYKHSAKMKRTENQFGQRAAKGKTMTRKKPILSFTLEIKWISQDENWVLSS